MKIDIAGKQFKVVPRLRVHVEEHIEKLNRYDSHIISVHVVLKTQKYLNIAEVTVMGSHFEFFGIGVSDDNMFAAVDLAVYRIEAQLKKHRERFKEHNKRNRRLLGRLRRSLEAVGPQVVSSEVYSPRSLTLEEASLELDTAGKDSIVFLNSQTKKISVLYKRSDGHHSLVEPEV